VEEKDSMKKTVFAVAALGHTTGWPVYRSKWGEMGTLHRRFGGCNKQVRAKPFKAQGPRARNTVTSSTSSPTSTTASSSTGLRRVNNGFIR
jgi:hypothetical protein